MAPKMRMLPAGGGLDPKVAERLGFLLKNNGPEEEK
jgi:hypothetical protein